MMPRITLTVVIEAWLNCRMISAATIHAIERAADQVAKLGGVAHRVIAVTVVHQHVALARLVRELRDRPRELIELGLGDAVPGRWCRGG
jgi:hypothetical protein